MYVGVCEMCMLVYVRCVLLFIDNNYIYNKNHILLLHNINTMIYHRIDIIFI